MTAPLPPDRATTEQAAPNAAGAVEREAIRQIIENCLPCTALNPKATQYELGYFDGVMQFQKNLNRDFALSQSDGWQPIETAPKDGTRIQLMCVRSPRFTLIPPVLWIKVGKWCAHYKDGYEEGWREDAVSAPHEARLKLTPTHWRLLPAPPIDGGGK